VFQRSNYKLICGSKPTLNFPEIDLHFADKNVLRLSKQAVFNNNSNNNNNNKNNCIDIYNNNKETKFLFFKL
jgi:hypothetical protein